MKLSIRMRYEKYTIWIFQSKNRIAAVFVYILIHIQKLKPLHARSLSRQRPIEKEGKPIENELV